MIIEQLYCLVDDYCIALKTNPSTKLFFNSTNKRNRKTKLSSSEIITIIIFYYFKNYRNFKSYYQEYVCVDLAEHFPDLVSYNRFIELIPRVLTLVTYLLKSLFGKSTGISYIDSTRIKVCDNKRNISHKVFKGLAELGKSTKGWFYGFKLHVVCNHLGDIINLQFTKGNLDDRKPVIDLSENISGKLYADKGYISNNLFVELLGKGITLITSAKRNMKNKILSKLDRELLAKRNMIESVFNQLKDKFRLEHTRHRSCINAFAHMISGLVAYCLYPNKASIS